MKHLEYHQTEHIWIWRIYQGQIKTSAFIPYKDGERPAGLTDEQYRKELERMQEDDEGAF